MKRIITTSLMLVLIAACSFAQSVVGKWKATQETLAKIEFEEGTTMTLALNANKTCNMQLDIKMEQDISEGLQMIIKITAVVPYKYTASNGMFTIIETGAAPKVNIDIQAPGLDKETLDMIKREIEPSMADVKKEFVNDIKGAFAKDNQSPYTVSGNVLTIDGMTFTRVR